MSVPPHPSIETCIAIRNLCGTEITLYLEPWAEEYRMVSQSEIILIGRGPQKGNGFTVDYQENAVVVSGWTGSVVQLFSEGKELGDVRYRPPVPDFD